MADLEPPYEAIWRSLCEGDVVPCLGAAASFAGRPNAEWNEHDRTGLPSGAELSHYLARLVTFPEEDPRDRADLAKVAAYFDLIMGRRALQKRLHEIFGHQYVPGGIHQLLASVPRHLLIVQTNWDNLVEQAFDSAGRPYEVVIYPSDRAEWGGAVLHLTHGATDPEPVAPKRLQIDLRQTSVIFKIHGAVDFADESRDAYVISEADNIDLMIRVATQTAIPAIFAEPFQTRSFLFLGYSLRDWSLRVLLSRVATDLHRRGAAVQPSWAIQRRPSALERELWAKQNVRLYPMDLRLFVENMLRVSGTPVLVT